MTVTTADPVADCAEAESLCPDPRSERILVCCDPGRPLPYSAEAQAAIPSLAEIAQFAMNHHDDVQVGDWLLLWRPLDNLHMDVSVRPQWLLVEHVLHDAVELPHASKLVLQITDIDETTLRTPDAQRLADLLASEPFAALRPTAGQPWRSNRALSHQLAEALFTA